MGVQFDLVTDARALLNADAELSLEGFEAMMRVSCPSSPAPSPAPSPFSFLPAMQQQVTGQTSLAPTNPHVPECVTDALAAGTWCGDEQSQVRSYTTRKVLEAMRRSRGSHASDQTFPLKMLWCAVDLLHQGAEQVGRTPPTLAHKLPPPLRIR